MSSICFSVYRGEDQCSNFLTDTIQFFQEDFTDFFEKDIPNFFESTIPKTAIHVGDEIVDVAETGISELVKFSNGKVTLTQHKMQSYMYVGLVYKVP